MTLNQMPLEKIKVGMLVCSLTSGVKGMVSAVSEKPDREDYTVDIIWLNGNHSHIWHFDLSNVAADGNV